MIEHTYSGYIVREYFDADGWLCQTRSDERIFVMAFSREQADILIHELYRQNEKRWIPSRTSAKFQGDKVFVDDLKTGEELVAQSADTLEQRV